MKPRLLAPLLLALSALGAQGGLLDAAGPDLPVALAAGSDRVWLEDERPPTAFTVLADGRLVLVDDSLARLRIVDPVTGAAEVPLHGAAFDPERSHLVDVAPWGHERVLLLDAAEGKLHVATLDGEVLESAGVFVGPVRLEVGPDGTAAVWDPGAGSVTLFDPALTPVAHLEGLSLEPTPTSRRELPLLEVSGDGAALRIRLQAPARGPRPAPRTSASFLAEVPALLGHEILTATSLGVHDGRLWVQVLSARAGSPEPDLVEVVSVDLGGGGRPLARTRVASPTGGCLDCGPDLVLGADGDLYGYLLDDTAYRVYRLRSEGGRR